MTGQCREQLGIALGVIRADKARRGGMSPAGSQQRTGKQAVPGAEGCGRQPPVAGAGQPERHQAARQGPGTGAGPWRAPSAAGAAHVGAAVPVGAIPPPQEAQPTAAFPYLAILTEHQDNRSVMRVQGELDIGSRAHLRHTIAAVLNRRKPWVLVLDLSGLSFIDCTGLGVLMWAHQRQAEQGFKLILANVQPTVRRVLRLTSCDTILHFGPP